MIKGTKLNGIITEPLLPGRIFQIIQTTKY